MSTRSDLPSPDSADEQRSVRRRFISFDDTDVVTKLTRVESIIDERDRLYDARFKAAETAVAAALAAQEKAVGAALAAQEKQTASSFMASEKAIVKAEDAQREYNVRSNEFRGQLDDQAKSLMPRTETVTMVRALEDKIVAGDVDREKKFDSVSKELATLRESKSNMDGRMIVLGIAGAAVVAILVSLMSAALLSLLRSAPASLYPSPVVAPQVIYSPAPPNTMLPTTPPQPVPR